MRFLKIGSLSFAIIILIYLSNPHPSLSQDLPKFKDLIIGQRLTFLVSWNGIPVGTVTTMVEGLTKIRDRKAYKIVLHAKTNRWASLIYNVDDEFVTYIDYETSNSLRHEVARSEGKYRKKAIVEYIYDKFLAEYRYLKDERRKTIDIPSNIQDPLSAAYYFLRIDFKVGDKINLNIDLNEKSYNLCAYVKKGQKFYLPGTGKVDTVIIRPYVERKGKPYKRGNGWAYVTLGKKKLPVFCVVRVFIWGRFTASLKEKSPSKCLLHIRQRRQANQL